MAVSRARAAWHDYPLTDTLVRADDLELWDSELYNLRTTTFNVKDSGFGATGDGVTDDTAAIQAAITAAAASVPGTTYGTSFMAEAQVILPPGVYQCSGLTLPAKVHLRGYGARLRANASGYILTMSGKVPMVSGVMFDGNGVAKASSGIICDSTARLYVIDRCRFQDFYGRAILSDTTSNGKITNCYSQNVLLNTASLSTYSGALEMNGSDCWVSDCEFSGPTAGAGISANGYACAVAVYGNNCMFVNVVAELCDHGLYVKGPQNASNKFVNCRADLNYGHGFLIAGGLGQFSNCHAYRNGQATSFTYSGFNCIATTACNYMFDNCLAECSATTQHLYGFNDQAQSSQINKNQYTNCRSVGHGSQGFRGTGDGPMISFPPSSRINAATSTAALPVDQVTDYLMLNIGAFTVTSLTLGINGQVVRFYGDGFTTLQNNATIKPSGGADLLLASGRVYSFIRQASIWYQL